MTDRPEALFFSDLHAHPTSTYSTTTKGGGTEFLQSLERTLSWVKTQVLWFKPYWVVCLGDVFHVPGVVDALSLQIIWNGISEIADACEEVGADLAIIPGNHDMLLKSQGVHSIPFLENYLYDQPALVQNSNKSDSIAAFIPYIQDTTIASRMLDSLLTSPAKLSFIGTHLDAKGMLWNAHRKSEIGVDVDKYSTSGTPIFNGHHHTPENHYPWVNVGSSLYRNFSDHLTETPRGVCVFNGHGASIPVFWVENPHTEIFHTIRLTDSSQTAELAQFSAQQKKRLNLKVITSEGVEPPVLEGVNRVKIERAPVQKVKRTLSLADVSAASSPSDLLKAYLDAQQGLDPKTRELVESIFAEASTKVRPNFSSLAYQTPLVLDWISCHNFMSYERMEFEFSTSRFLLVEGRNGVGKSAFTTEALLWCLFGKTLRGLPLDEVVRDGQDLAVVSVQFTSDGIPYQVVRTRSKAGKSTLEFERNDEELTCQRMEETQALIEQSLGRTFDQFRQLIVLDLSVKFGSLSDTAKKDFIESMVDSSFFQAAYEEAEGLSTEAYNKVQSINTSWQSLGTQITTTQRLLVKAKEDESSWEENKANKLALLKSSLEKALEVEKNQNDEVSKYLEEEKERKEELRLVSDELETLRDGEVNLSRKLAVVKQNVVQTNHVLDECSSLLSGECPTCGQEVELSQETEDLKKSASRDLVNLIHQEEVLGQQLSELSGKLSRLKSNEKLLKMSVSALSDKIRQSMSSSKSNSESIKRQISFVENEAAPQLVTRLEADIAVLESKKAELFKAGQTAGSDFKRMEEVLFHFGPQGVRSYVLDRAIGRINFYLSDILSTFDASITCSISPEKNLKKKGAVVQKIDLACTPRSYKAASRGEKKKIDFSIPLAFRRFLSEECGAVNLLVVDECDDGLDYSGMESLVEILAQERCTVLFVSHHNPLKSLIPESVLVTKTDEAGSILTFSSMQAP